MTRFLLSAVSIFVLLITTFYLPRSASARRCPEVTPNTLLSLYRTSDAIYIGNYEKSVDGEVTEDTPDYTVVPITKHYSISSALKGETRKMLTLGDTEYRYKNQEAVEEESTEGNETLDPESGHEETLEESDEIRPGDQVLIFVKKNEETEAIELTEGDDGIKKMTSDKLSSYGARVRELNDIFSSEKPKYSELVEWMVRCAEDPHTRWEGTFELLQSFYNIDWQEERKKQPKPEIVSGITEQFIPEPPKNFETGDMDFARNLTDAHKRALTSILTHRRPQVQENSPDQPSLIHGDRELIELVRRWGDSNVVSHLVEQLRLNSADANLNSELMRSIALILKDDELSGISEDYFNIEWQSHDDAIVEEDTVGREARRDDAAFPEGLAENESVLLPKANDSEVAGTEQIEETAGDAAGVIKGESPKKKKTYGEVRSELLTKFLARVDTVIEIERNKNSAKLDN